MSYRRLLCELALVAALAAAPAALLRGQGPGIPITGKSDPVAAPFDAAMTLILRRHGVPGGTLAVTKNGKLLYARGFGYADIAGRAPVQPTTIFGLASVSKPLTATAVFVLIEEGKLKLDDRAFDHLKGVRPPRGARVDPRLRQITIRQLLDHSGGWDRNKSGEPITWSQRISLATGARLPLSAEQFVSFMMGVPLDFAPGTRQAYSNLGFIILGLVIEKVSGESYDAFVRRKVLAPAGIKRAVLLSQERRPVPGLSLRYLAGMAPPLPPSPLPLADASGGWSLSAVDLARFVTALDGRRGKALLSPRSLEQMFARPAPPLRAGPGPWIGLGWDQVLNDGKAYAFAKNGNDYGARAFLKRQSNGVAFICLLNASMQPDLTDVNLRDAAIRDVRELIERTGEFPKADLFELYP
jgi:N-acyl-D-amino-acid deacylase